MNTIEGIGSPSEIHQRFAASQYGESMQGLPRWERYAPEDFTAQAWIELLGADFDRLEHHAYSALVATAFIQYNRVHTGEIPDGIELDAEDEKILMLAAVSNDWGEAIVGDVSYELKTVDDVRHEREKFGPIFQEIIGPQGVKYQYMVEDVLFGKRDSAVGKAWDAIERMTYLHDALLAYRESKSVDDEALSAKLQWLAAAALPNHTSKLVEYCKLFPAVRSFIDQNQAVITEAYDRLDPQVFAEHGQKEKQKVEQFIFEKNYWQNRKIGDAGQLEADIVGMLERAGVDEETISYVKKQIENYGQLRSNPLRPFISREAYDRGILGTGTNFEARLLSDLDAARQMADALRVLNLKVVLTSGSFDMWHIGHARYIELAKQHGDFLVVGVDSDEKIKSRKGPNRPMVPEGERLEIVAHERSVDAIILKSADEEKWGLIRAIRPDTLIVTDETYSDEEKKELLRYCGRVIALPPQATTSTSARLRRLNMEIGDKIAARLPEHLNEIIRSIINED